MCLLLVMWWSDRSILYSSLNWNICLWLLKIFWHVHPCELAVPPSLARPGPGSDPALSALRVQLFTVSGDSVTANSPQKTRAADLPLVLALRPRGRWAEVFMTEETYWETSLGQQPDRGRQGAWAPRWKPHEGFLCRQWDPFESHRWQPDDGGCRQTESCWGAFLSLQQGVTASLISVQQFDHDTDLEKLHVWFFWYFDKIILSCSDYCCSFNYDLSWTWIVHFIAL